MNPYADLIQRLNRPLFVPFTVLGDPDEAQSIDIIETLIANSADALEVGLPFSDPPADGPVIQAADKRALDAGITVDDCFSILKTIRKKHALPIGMLTYFNPVFVRGVDRFYADCKASGVTSVLVADLPLEHATDILGAAKKHGIAPVFLVSERTDDDRLRKIADVADGYLYLVSYLGVTGKADAIDVDPLKNLIERCRRVTQLPLMVGFGIHTPADIERVIAAGADGAIVGSRLVADAPHLDRLKNTCRELRSVLAPLQ